MRVLKKDESIGKYTVCDRIHTGAFTICYKAQYEKRMYFIKAFKSPAPSSSWYNGYSKYIERLSSKLVGCSDYICRPLEIIKDKTGFIYQVFDYVSDGRDLDQFLNEHSGETVKKNETWKLRVHYATQLVNALQGLHEAGIVHGDLKPENLMVDGEFFRVTDFDFAIMDKEEVPWIGKMGNVTTALYKSPEHLRGVMPQFASDVFTCGIILCWILCNTNPYGDFADMEDYERRELAGAFKIPQLLGSFKGSNEPVRKILKDCLNPDPELRPSAERLAKTLNYTFHSIVLNGSVGQPVVANIRTEIGRNLLRSVTPSDAQYVDSLQYVLIPTECAGWLVEPAQNTTNETLLNGKKIIEKTFLSKGDRLAVGREDKEIEKAQVSVDFI